MVKRGRPFKSNSQATECSKRPRVEEYDSDACDDDIPIEVARHYRKEMANEEAQRQQDAGGDVDCPKRRDDILYFRRTAKEFVEMLPKLNPRQVKAVHELGFGGILNYRIPKR